MEILIKITELDEDRDKSLNRLFRTLKEDIENILKQESKTISMCSFGNRSQSMFFDGNTWAKLGENKDAYSYSIKLLM